MGKIAIATPQEVVAVDRKRVREVVRAVLDGEGVADAEISLAFVDNPTIHRSTSATSTTTSRPTCSAFRSASRTRSEWPASWSSAPRWRWPRPPSAATTFSRSWRCTSSTACLHLCGYDDKNDEAARVMRERERHYLRELGLPDIV